MPSSTNDFLTPTKCPFPKGPSAEMKDLAQLEMPCGSIDNWTSLKYR